MVELWDRPPHTEAKHELLRTYLSAWFPIMAKYNRRVVYYDAFTGPGKYKGGEPGSPIIALRTLIDHNFFDSLGGTEFIFLFNEADDGCAAHLQDLVDELRESRKPWPSNVKYFISNQTFIDVTTEMLDDLDSRNVRLAPTFAFVDPVGVKETPMSVLQRLTDYPKAELLVYFAHEFVFRFCGAENVDHRLIDLFGNEEYKGAALLSGQQRSQYIHDLYKQQLHELCDFPYIQSFSMYDYRSKRLYDLYYCTREPIGPGPHETGNVEDRARRRFQLPRPLCRHGHHLRQHGRHHTASSTPTRPLRRTGSHHRAGHRARRGGHALR